MRRRAATAACRVRQDEGCGACAEACPSAAISMVPKEMPPQPPKDEKVTEALWKLIRSKAHVENLAAQLSGPFGAAVEKSSRLMAEDLCREAGYMLPQSGNAKAFLESLKKIPDVPSEIVERLLDTIPFQEEGDSH